MYLTHLDKNSKTLNFVKTSTISDINFNRYLENWYTRIYIVLIFHNLFQNTFN